MKCKNLKKGKRFTRKIQCHLVSLPTSNWVQQALDIFLSWTSCQLKKEIGDIVWWSMANYPNDRAHFGGIHSEYCNWYLSINSLTHYHDIPPVNIIIIIIMSSHHLFAIKDWDFFSTIVHGFMLIIFSMCDQYLCICRLNKSNRSIDWCVCVCVHVSALF